MFAKSFILLFNIGISLGPVIPLPLDENVAPSIFNKLPQKQAQQMLSFMNTSMDPCMDFYEYACGNFGQVVAPIQASRLQILGHSMDAHIRKLMEDYDFLDTELDENIKSFYWSCVNVGQLLPEYPQKLRSLVKEFGKMPLLQGDDWKEEDFNWQEVVASIANKMDISIMLRISIEPDFRNSSNNMVTLKHAPLNFIYKEFYARNPDHIKHIIAFKLKKYLGIEADLASETAKELFDFELALAQGRADDISTLQKFEIYETIGVEELQMKYNNSWNSKKLIEDSLNFLPTQVNSDHKYMKNLAEVLDKTPKRVVANHIFYSYLSNFIVRLRPSKEEMAKHCLTETKNNFYKYLENKIYRKYFTEDMKQVIYLLWKEIKTSFEYILHTPRLSWLRPETRLYAVEKLKAMNIQINSYEDVNFSKEFEGLKFQENDYIYNLKSLYIQQSKKSQEKRNQSICPNEMGAASANTPSYSETDNQLNIPVSILQPFYFYSTNYPYAFNFGSLGSYLAHEIIHGFDDNGRNYDAHGNNHNWWDPESSLEFQKRTQCLMDQYKTFVFNGSPLPEMKLQSENIADNSGIRLAYESYRLWHNNNSNTIELEDFMPILELNHSQLFFLSYGQTWCTSEDLEEISYRLNSDPHVPHKFRVNGPLSNFEEFSREFNCPLGSAMNPVEKCEIY